MNTFEIVEPEVEIVIAGIIFDEGELRPAHGAAVPVGIPDCSVELRELEKAGGREARRLLEEGSSTVCHGLRSLRTRPNPPGNE